MPEAEPFEAPQGSTFFGRYLEAITEAFVGNGITNNGDAEVTADPNTAMGIDVAAATDLSYDGTVYSPSANSFTLSNGPSSTTGGQDDRRVDLVYFDSSAGTYAVEEGSPAPNPEPPTTPADALLLALVAVPHAATNVDNGDIHNWRAHPAMSAVVSEGFESPPGTTDFGPLFNIPVESNTAQGTEVSYSFTIDGEQFAYLYSESDGSGGIQNSELTFGKPVSASGGLDVTGSHPNGNGVSTDFEINGVLSLTDTLESTADFETFGSFVPKGGAAISYQANRSPGNTFAEAPVDGNASAGQNVGQGFNVGGTTIMWVTAEADGAGGIQDAYLRLFEDLRLTGGADIDKATTGASAGTELSYYTRVGGDPFVYHYAEEDGAGGIQNGEVIFPKPFSGNAGFEVSGTYPGGNAVNADFDVNGVLSLTDTLESTADFETFGSFIPKGGTAISYQPNRSPGNTFAAAPTDSNASAGQVIGQGFTAGGDSVVWIAAEADGSGGTQAAYLQVRQDLRLTGGDVDKPTLGSSAGTELSYYTRVGGDPFVYHYAEEDGTGGIQNGEVIFTKPFSGNGGFSVSGTYPGGNAINADFDVTGLIDSTDDFETFGSFVPKGGAAIVFPANRTWGNTTISAPVDSNANAGSEYGQSFDAGGGTILSLRAEADGSGGVNGRRAVVHEPVDHVTGDTLVDAGGELQRDTLSRPTDRVSWALSQEVSQTSQRSVAVDSLADGETLEIDKAAFVLEMAQAVPSGVNLELVTFDGSGGYTTQSTILSGDGATIYDDETGSPLASYTNSSGSEQSVGVIIDNTTNNAQDLATTIEGRTGR